MILWPPQKEAHACSLIDCRSADSPTAPTPIEKPLIVATTWFSPPNLFCSNTQETKASKPQDNRLITSSERPWRFHSSSFFAELHLGDLHLVLGKILLLHRPLNLSIVISGIVISSAPSRRRVNGRSTLRACAGQRCRELHALLRSLHLRQSSTSLQVTKSTPCPKPPSHGGHGVSFDVFRMCGGLFCSTCTPYREVHHHLGRPCARDTPRERSNSPLLRVHTPPNSAPALNQTPVLV